MIALLTSDCCGEEIWGRVRFNSYTIDFKPFLSRLRKDRVISSFATSKSTG